MSRVFVTTEALYRNKGYHEFIPPVSISVEELVEVLESCAKPGPDRRYMLVTEETSFGLVAHR